MLSSDDLKKLLAAPDLSRRNVILLMLAFDECSIKRVIEIKGLAKSHGLRRIEKWNISQVLKDLGDKAVRLDEGWEITPQGIHELSTAGLLAQSPLVAVNSSLRSHLVNISGQNTHAFVSEAIAALEHGLVRSAIVLSWVGAASTLYDYVVANKLQEFNAEALHRDTKWKPAKNQDDLCKMKEFSFLEVLEAISVIGKNCKKELQDCLARRNSCGHPNSLVIGESMVAAHIEMLILNVYLKFEN